MNPTAYLGIDPGKSGSLVLLKDDNALEFAIAAKLTEYDIGLQLREWCQRFEIFAAMEKVGSSPQMGVKSAFTFGESFGFLHGCLAAAGVRLVMVSPRKWQKIFDLSNVHGNKNITKACAQRHFPKYKITHATADAILIAMYARYAWIANGTLTV